MILKDLEWSIASWLVGSRGFKIKVILGGSREQKMEK